ncbi:MAG: alpha/beta hydrolase family protein [Myxococcota bacterium]
MAPSSSDYAQRGPFAVGVLATSVTAPLAHTPTADTPERQLPTEIWYPGRPGETARDDAAHPLHLPHLATEGLKPREEPCPLIAFSHGNSGLRQQSTFLTTHLASWGYVIVAPDHVGNTFSDTLQLETEEARQKAHLEARAARPTDLVAAIRGVLDEGLAQDALPPVDDARVGALGHSFGGWTAIKASSLEPRIQALCGLAPASEPFVGRKAFEEGELPLREAVDALILAAGDDVLVDLTTSIEPLFERLGPRAKLQVLGGLDHFHFCDGIELLHQMHVNNPRERQHRPTKPMSELRGEPETHTLLKTRVTRFFEKHLKSEPS